MPPDRDPDEAWEDPPRRPARAAVPEFHVAGFDGPLDLLLDLADRQRIDLGVMSIVALAEQFVSESERLADSTPLMRRAEWTVWIARLVLLRSKLLFAEPKDRQVAETEARRTEGQLSELLAMRAAAGWLARRPRLGVTVFARGASGDGDADRPAMSREASYFGLMEACLGVLERELAGLEEKEDRYQVVAPLYWRITDALARICEKIADGSFRSIWEGCLPPPRPDDVDGGARAALLRRAAVAGVFVAGLELVRQGEISVEQVFFAEG
jgi:segregation and condensation protein A